MTNDASEERKFLHDLASPLAAAIFVADSLLDELQSGSSDSGVIQPLSQIYAALEKAKTLIEERRKVLIERGVPSSKS